MANERRPLNIRMEEAITFFFSPNNSTQNRRPNRFFFFSSSPSQHENTPVSEFSRIRELSLVYMTLNITD